MRPLPSSNRVRCSNWRDTVKTNNKSWNLDTVNRRRTKINPAPQYQRTAVWSPVKKQLLIDSLLRGYDIPKFYLRSSGESKFEHEVVDGQQRLRAIWDFLSDQYPLGEPSKDLPQGDLSGKFYSDLSSDVKDNLSLYELNISIIEDASELGIRDLFLRLQEGVTLNPAERRNAMAGAMRDFIAKLANENKVFQKINIKNIRSSWDDLASLITCLELAGGPVDVKASNLREMYKANEIFDLEGPEAKRIKRNLNHMAKVLDNRPPEMNIKWGFVDLYLLLSVLDKEYAINGREEEIASFYVGFEQERISVNDLAELIENQDFRSKDLYEYIQAFQTSGGLRGNIETRHRCYLKRILFEIPNLAPKDSRRFFNKAEKIVIWRRNNGTCQKCSCKVSFNEMHADHIKPHSTGGVTTIENGQTLCGPCNLSKGTRN